MSDTPAVQRVVVVGAGLAGLTAAYRLAREGTLDVLLIEATDRVGGRVRTTDVAGVPVDLGGFLVFPWYDRYRDLCAELDLDDGFRHVPALEMAYDLGDRELVGEEALGLDLLDLVKTAARSLPSAFLSGSLDAPKLDFYDRRTIGQCIDEWAGDAETAAHLHRLVNTVCEGYCYPPVDIYKAAFAAPIYPRSLLRGGADDSDLLVHGSDHLATALHAAFEEHGGRTRLGCEATALDGHHLTTSTGEIHGDAFVFALPADHALYRCLLPAVTPPIAYTHFVTAVVTVDREVHADHDGWGAIFVAADPDRPDPQVLSMIHLARLYDDDALALHLTVNVRCRDGAMPDETTLRAAVAEVLPDGVSVTGCVARQDWPRAMPVSHEEVVATVRALQGIGGRYYAGDFLGCPSMEVAVRTGWHAAEDLLGDR